MVVAEKFKGSTGLYTYNKTVTLLPQEISKKAKPPVFTNCKSDNKELFTVKEKGWEEQAQNHMDDYRKAERILIVNFYTGGTNYSRGVLDSIYRGVNLLNP